LSSGDVGGLDLIPSEWISFNEHIEFAFIFESDDGLIVVNVFADERAEARRGRSRFWLLRDG
jgi:hypothetical protein